MEKFDIFRDIAERTKGDIYLGVVGPARTGKSTLIKKFMELLVLPHIKNPHDLERATDELPQSGAGRTIMTTEPKFIPEGGVEVVLKDSISLRVRLVDCVGYPVEGAIGYDEESGPRMVVTPWFDYEIPFEEAAEIGTKKVIDEHATLGLVVTTDGSITEIPREAYVPAEEKVVTQLKEIGKPFVVALNTTAPGSKATLQLAEELSEKYDVPVVPVNCLRVTQDDLYLVMEQILYEFPVNEVNIDLPGWVEELEPGHWLRREFEEMIASTVGKIRRLRDIDTAMEDLGQKEIVQDVVLSQMDLGSGVANLVMTAKEELFFQALEEMVGEPVEGKEGLVRLMRDLVVARKEYSRLAGALQDVEETGYGLVPPSKDQMLFEDPELIRRGNQFGVKLRASAPSLHLIRADIRTEVTPIMGTEKQCEELVHYIMEQFEDDPKKLWESHVFGKSMHDLVKEGIENKLLRMPQNAQQKLQETLERIINEGSGGLICIII
mgnify:CR=1 FL=1